MPDKIIQEVMDKLRNYRDWNSPAEVEAFFEKSLNRVKEAVSKNK